MRESETCPKCRSRKLFVVKEVGNEHADYAKTVPLPVAVVTLPTGGGLLGGSAKVVQAGRFEAWVCSKCGLTEWYAHDLEEIARLAETSSGVRVIDHEAETGAGPYRR
jgi:predicted nucleic-acid-binding Zn-ribbon protein